MTYYPLPTPPPARPVYGQSTTGTDSSNEIRTVPTSQDYDYGYSSAYQDTEEVYDDYRGSHGGGGGGERPPSFRSTTNDPEPPRGGAGVFLGLEEGDNDSYRTLPPSQSQYRARSDVDLDLHLESDSRGPAPRYATGGGVYEDLEDVKRPGDFEDSFEGDQSYVGHGRTARRREESDIVDEDEDDNVMRDLDSPTLSYKGGFGAPPTVSAPRNFSCPSGKTDCFPCSFPEISRRTCGGT